MTAYFIAGIIVGGLPIGICWWIHARELKAEINRHVVPWAGKW